jgi:hypothetical protein
MSLQPIDVTSTTMRIAPCPAGITAGDVGELPFEVRAPKYRKQPHAK